MTYYKLENNTLKKCGSVEKIDGRYVTNPTAEQYASIGAYPRSDESFAPPKCDEGYHAVADGYEVRDGKWTRKWRIEEVPPPPPRVFSKIYLKIAIARLGKLEALESWLASVEIEPGYSALAAWNDAQNISEDFEGFAEILGKVKEALGVSDEEVEAILVAGLAR